MTPPCRDGELETLRKEQEIASEALRSSVNDWYHKEGAWMGICDLLAEEALILIEMSALEGNSGLRSVV